MAENNEPQIQHTIDVGSQRVARVYAEALFSAAEKQGKVDEVIEELQSLVGEVFKSDPTVEAFFSSAAIGRKTKDEIILKVFEGRASELFLNFLRVLNGHDRLDLIRTILAAMQDLSDQRARRIRVQVRSAVPLADDQREQLSRDLRQNFHLEPVLEAQVDPELLGGMVVKVGDWLYDGSVRTGLETIRKQLIESSSHVIQSRRDTISS